MAEQTTPVANTPVEQLQPNVFYQGPVSTPSPWGAVYARGPYEARNQAHPKTPFAEKIELCKTKYLATLDHVAQKIIPKLEAELDQKLKELETLGVVSDNAVTLRILLSVAVKEFGIVLPPLCSEQTVHTYLTSLGERITSISGTRVGASLFTKGEEIKNWVLEFHCPLGRRDFY